MADGVSPRADGKLDIYGFGFDTIFSTAVPARHPRLVLVVRALISKHEARHKHSLNVVLQAADGAEIARADADVEALPDETRDQVPAGRRLAAGLVLNFEDVIFPVCAR